MRNTTDVFSVFFKDKNCEYFFAPFDVRLPIPDKIKTNTVVQPDLYVICDASKLDEKGCNGVPDLIVEILSKGNSSHDLTTKFDLYEEVDLPEYWIINPWDKTVIIYSAYQGKFQGSKTFIGDDTVLTSKLFPSLQVQLAALFKGVD